MRDAGVKSCENVLKSLNHSWLFLYRSFKNEKGLLSMRVPTKPHNGQYFKKIVMSICVLVFVLTGSLLRDLDKAAVVFLVWVDRPERPHDLSVEDLLFGLKGRDGAIG